MKSTILHMYGFNLHYASKLMEGITPAKACDQPSGIPNHAAWVIGHLAASSGFAAFLLGSPMQTPAEWDELYGLESKPTTDVKRYAPLPELYSGLEAGHAHVAAAYEAASDELLNSPTAHEGFRQMFPTTGVALAFMMASHETLHLGQLSAWRRGIGLGSAL